MSDKPITSVLIKPAGPDCNMACTYCFYLKKAAYFPDMHTHRMSEAVLRETVRQVMMQGAVNVSFGWQGGEPTLMGVRFFEQAVEFQKRFGRGRTVGNGLQTNGVLIDDAWCRFLKQYRFLVGLSLDGPEQIHDRYRKMRGGTSSWHRVVDSASRMLDGDVAVNALIVLNDYSSQFPETIYAFHKDLGLTYMQFIPCVEPDGTDPSKTAPFSVSAEVFGDCLCRLFDLWIADFKDGEPTTSIRFFESVFYVYVGMEPPECTLCENCGNYVVIEHNGDVFSCDFFVEESWKLGNVLERQLSEMLNSELQNRFGACKTDLPAECLECEWLPKCRGGCPKDRTFSTRHQKLNHLCNGFKRFFSHADGRLEELAEAWRKKQVKAATRERVRTAVRMGAVDAGRNDPCPCGSGLKYKQCCGGD